MPFSIKVTVIMLAAISAAALQPPAVSAAALKPPAVSAGGDDRRRTLEDAESHLAAGRFAEALEMFKRIIDDDPGDVRALVGLAELYAMSQDPEYYDGKQAVEYALMALDKAPNDLRVVETLAEGYFAQSQFERAILEIEKCIAASPEDPRLYKKLRRYALTWKGRQDIDLAGRDRPLLAKVHFHLGQADFHLGNNERACEYLRKAYDIDAGLAGVAFLLAEALMAVDDADGAAQVLRDNEGSLSGDPRYYQLLGKALAQGGDLAGAIEQYRKARDRQRDLPGLLFELGRVYLENGDNVRALMIFNEALEMRRGTTFHDRRRRAEIELLAGRALVGLGEGEKALAMYYRSAAALDGGAEPERRLRALFAEKHGRNLDPRRYFAGLDPVPWPAPVFFSNVSGEEGDGAPGPGDSEQGGVAWGDFDLDGDADLLVGGTALYVNEGRNGFKPAPESLGFRELSAAAGALFADIDADGDLDIFVFCGKRGFRDRLFRNDGKLGFKDATEESADSWDVLPTSGGAFGDLNGDGQVDLYLVNCGDAGGEKSPVAEGSPDSLFINNGDGTFRNAAEEAGLLLDRPLNGAGIVITDFDSDGDQDIHVVNGDYQPNLLWRNGWADSGMNPDAPGFTDAAGAAGLRGRESYGNYGDSRGVAAGDVDGDGDIDFFLANAAPYLDLEFADTSQLYLNGGRPDFAFAEAFDRSGICYDEVLDCPALGDVDNDGDLDLFVAARGEGCRSRLYVNDGGGRFMDLTWIAGLAVEDACGCAFADFDGDGDLDLFVNGAGGGLFENSGNGNHWIGFRLRGASCNGSGIGARVTIDAGGRSMVREVRGGRGCCQDDMAVHFGLGLYKGKVNVSILWPNGKSAYVANLRADRYHVIEE